MWIEALMHCSQSSRHQTANGGACSCVLVSVHSIAISITRAFCFTPHTETSVFASLSSALPSDTTRPRERLTSGMTAPWSLTFIFQFLFLTPPYNRDSTVTEWTGRQGLMGMGEQFLSIVVSTQLPIQQETGSLTPGMLRPELRSPFLTADTHIQHGALQAKRHHLVPFRALWQRTVAQRLRIS